MKNINDEPICGEIWTKDYAVVGTGTGVSQRTECYYCTKKPNHLGPHVATYEGEPYKVEDPNELHHGKILKAWIS